MSSTFGTALKLMIFGQSHAPAIGMCMDGFPSGFAPDFEALQQFLSRRAPGQGAFTTPRREADRPEFLSGFSGGKTCGAPIAAIIQNTNVHSQDYVNLTETPRPAHADWVSREKYGDSTDLSGGGHFSGRLTAPLCIAGGLCLQYLQAQNIHIGAHILRIGQAEDDRFDAVHPNFSLENGYTVKPEAWSAMLEEIAAARSDGDSVGGVIECAVTGLPVGLGEPMFGGMENRLSQILFGIPAVKGVEFGSGFACAGMRGSVHNDPFCLDDSGAFRTKTNNAGGILGGITNAMPLIFRIAIKPTPSISRPQETVRFDGTATTLKIQGRHDPCIVPRALPCVEAAAAIAILDVFLEGKKWN